MNITPLQKKGNIFLGQQQQQQKWVVTNNNQGGGLKSHRI